MPAPKNVIADPNVINFVITGPTFLISLLFKVKPPSKRIILLPKNVTTYSSCRKE